MIKRKVIHLFYFPDPILSNENASAFHDKYGHFICFLSLL